MSLLRDLARVARRGQRALRDAQRVVDAVEGAAVNLRGVAAGIENTVAVIEGGASQARAVIGAVDKVVQRATKPAPVVVAARESPSRTRRAPSHGSAEDVVDAEVIDFGVSGGRR